VLENWVALCVADLMDQGTLVLFIQTTQKVHKFLEFASLFVFPLILSLLE